MAEHVQQAHNGSVEKTDRGMFDFMKRKDHQENVAEAEKPKEEKHNLMEKLHSSDTHSIVVEEKKGFLDKVKEKLPGNAAEEAPPGVTTTHDHEAGELGEGEHKGFLDKIKGKIPGYGHKTDDQKEKPKDH